VENSTAKKTASITRVFTQADVEAFAALTGDANPVHLDAEYAAGTRFGQRIAHGMLAASLFSTIFGTIEPGPGALYLGQDLKFKAPVVPGDQITATVTLENLREDKPIATYSTIATNQRGETVIAGQAVLFLPKN
jgi:acyl dehydratase